MYAHVFPHLSKHIKKKNIYLKKMKVQNNKDDVLSKGYLVSGMLIVLSTVFICQDSQRACIHFVCSSQMGPCKHTHSACAQIKPCVFICPWIYAYDWCLSSAHICRCCDLLMQYLSGLLCEQIHLTY